MRGLLIFAKEGQFDILFKEEGLIRHLIKLIQVTILDKRDFILKSTSAIVNKKEILQEDLIYDLANYGIGTIKCFTQQN